MRLEQQIQMWNSARTFLFANMNRGAFDLPRKLSCSSGLLLGSAIFANQKQDSEGIKFKWRHIEFPTQPKQNDVLLSRKINSSLDKTGLNLRLYQYQTCPYCCKVRAFLDYFAFSYEVVEVNPVTRSQIKFSKEYKKVPILTSSALEQPIVESSLIVSALYTYLVQPKQSSLKEVMTLYEGYKTLNEKGQEVVSYPNQHYIMYTDGQLTPIQIGQAREEREWREWVDNHFIHLISPNVYRSWSESLETFRFFDEIGEWKRNFPMWERYMAIYVGASAMFFISKRLKKRHNIDDERKALKDAFNKFLAARGPRRFMGGDHPNLADLALFGACNSFFGCAAFKEAETDCKGLREWFSDVQAQVIEGAGRALIEKRSSAAIKNE